MADGNTQLQWTDEQWNKVRQVVYEEARKARVAGNFLPLYGPLDPDATYVTRQALLKPNEQNEQGDSVAGFTVGDTSVLKLPTLQVKVYLKGAQVADPEMTSALIAFRRAASVLARLEDEIIFNGQKGPNEGPTHAGQRMALAKDEPWEVRGGDKTNGLLPPPPRPIRPEPGGALPSFTDLAKIGEALVSDVSKAVGDLEEKYHPGPFACVLDHVYFTAAQTPNPNSLVLPQDRILPFLGGGTLVRSSTLRTRSGLVVALGGAPIDLVVGTDICVGFLQVTTHPWFVFRVYEKIVLRIKQLDAIHVLPERATQGRPPAKKGSAAKDIPPNKG